jgi:hypothetical protein
MTLNVERVKTNRTKPWVHPSYRNKDGPIPFEMTKKRKLAKPNYSWKVNNVDDYMYTAQIFMGSNKQAFTV